MMAVARGVGDAVAGQYHMLRAVQAQAQTQAQTQQLQAQVHALTLAQAQVQAQVQVQAQLQPTQAASRYASAVSVGALATERQRAPNRSVHSVSPFESAEGETLRSIRTFESPPRLSSRTRVSFEFR